MTAGPGDIRRSLPPATTDPADGTRTSGGDGRSDDGTTTEAAVSLLADERRLAILARSRATDDGERALSFSALYERVDAANTPQFADHLRQLEGQFVRRHDDAYALTGPGEQVVRAVLVGTYDSRGTWVRQFESTNEV